MSGTEVLSEFDLALQTINRAESRADSLTSFGNAIAALTVLGAVGAIVAAFNDHGENSNEILGITLVSSLGSLFMALLVRAVLVALASNVELNAQQVRLELTSTSRKL